MTKEIQAKDAEMQVGGRSNFDETRNLAKEIWGLLVCVALLGGASFSLLLFPVPTLSYMSFLGRLVGLQLAIIL